MKRVFALVLTMGMVVAAFAGCGGGSDSGSGAAAGSGSGDTFTMRCASVENTERQSVAMLYDFEEVIEERTDGAIDVEIYPDGQLGSDQECLEGALMGDVQLTLPATSNLDVWDSKFDMFDIPYLITSWDQQEALAYGEAGDYYKTEAEGYGFKVYGYGVDGGRCIFNRLKEVNSMADLKGMKIRVLESQVYLDTFGALGMNPTPMALSELYTGLSQGTVDACSSIIGIQWDGDYIDVCEYALFDNHFFQTLLYVGDLNWYNSLPDDLKAILDEEMDSMIKEQREAELAKEDTYKQNFYDNATVSEFTDDMRKEFQTAVTPVYESYRKLMGDECTDILLKGVGQEDLF